MEKSMKTVKKRKVIIVSIVTIALVIVVAAGISVCRGKNKEIVRDEVNTEEEIVDVYPELAFGKELKTNSESTQVQKEEQFSTTSETGSTGASQTSNTTTSNNTSSSGSSTSDYVDYSFLWADDTVQLTTAECDTNGNGVIDKEEFRYYQNGYVIVPNDYEMCYYDEDGDGIMDDVLTRTYLEKIGADTTPLKPYVPWVDPSGYELGTAGWHAYWDGKTFGDYYDAGGTQVLLYVQGTSFATYPDWYVIGSYDVIRYGYFEDGSDLVGQY